MAYRHILTVLLLGAFCVGVTPAQAFEITAVNQAGEPAADVALILTPSTPVKAKPEEIAIAQKKYEFKPRFSVVPKGSTVSFPNMDTAHHHVYSFSEAKQFQFELYKGKSPEVTVEKTGIISLGCNIHDWMMGFIVVTDSPYYAVTDDDGEADFGDVPPGSYKVSYWYPGMDERKGVQVMGNLEVKGSEHGKLTVKMEAPFEWPKKPNYLPREY